MNLLGRSWKKCVSPPNALLNLKCSLQGICGTMSHCRPTADAEHDAENWKSCSLEKDFLLMLLLFAGDVLMLLFRVVMSCGWGWHQVSSVSVLCSASSAPPCKNSPEVDLKVSEQTSEALKSYLLCLKYRHMNHWSHFALQCLKSALVVCYHRFALTLKMVTVISRNPI